MAALTAADPIEDIDMDSSPRIESLPAPTQPQQPAICHTAEVQVYQHQEPAIMPISQSDNSFEHLLTTLPTAVKIEELHFTVQQPSTAAFDAELAHLHK